MSAVICFVRFVLLLCLFSLLVIFQSITKGVKCSIISVFHLQLNFVVRLGYHEPCEAGDVIKRRKKTAEWVGLDVSSYHICFLSVFFFLKIYSYRYMGLYYQ